MKAYIVHQPAQWGRDVIAALIREDGTCLATHLCSSPGFAPGDLWEHRKERQEKWPDLEVDLNPMGINEFKEKHPVIFDKAFVVSEDESLDSQAERKDEG